MKKLLDYRFDIEKSDIAEVKRRVKEFLLLIRSMQSSVGKNIWLKELSAYSGVGEPALAEELMQLPEKVKLEEEDLGEVMKETRVERIAKRLAALAFTNESFLSIVLGKKELLPPKYVKILEEGGKESGFLEMQGAYESMNIPEETLKEELDELLRHLETEILSGEMLTLRGEMHAAEEKDEKLYEEKSKEFLSKVQRIQDLRNKKNI